MNPQSLNYITMTAAAALVHRLLPGKMRNIFLLAVSWIFYYACMPSHAPYLLVVTVLAWGFGLWMEKTPERKKAILTLGLCAAFGMLFLFKYLHFTGQVLTGILGRFGLPPIELPAFVQPLGISFYLFTVTGYLIDLYRSTVTAEHDFIDFALFVGFFPAILSGPIARSTHLLPQIKAHKVASGPHWQEAKRGITRFIVGLFKKMLLADQLSVIVSTVFATPESFGGLQMIVAILAYAMQIYCDFSSYSDMAVGAGLLFGLQLTENFDTPYFSASIQEFWRRWHISLSTWFRDYLYFPLGGSRKGTLRLYLNQMIVFAVSGLWHGAANHYLAWGLLHGGYQVCGRIMRPLLKPMREKLDAHPVTRAVHRLCAMGITFGLTCLAWVFFRADSVSHAFRILMRLTTRGVFDLSVLGLSMPVLRLIGLALLLLLLWDLCAKKYDLVNRISDTVWLRWIFWTALVLLVLCFGAYGSGYNAAEFVYFQF